MGKSKDINKYMKSYTKILQEELRIRKYLSINDVIELSNKYNHFLDTSRRKLEEDYTPYSLKEMKGNRIKGWRYLPEKDVKDFVVPINKVKEKIQEPLFNIRVPLN
jgi:hypothetical protein